jgi:hypothetical protein
MCSVVKNFCVFVSVDRRQTLSATASVFVFKKNQVIGKNMKVQKTRLYFNTKTQRFHKDTKKFHVIDKSPIVRGKKLCPRVLSHP